MKIVRMLFLSVILLTASCPIYARHWEILFSTNLTVSPDTLFTVNGTDLMFESPLVFGKWKLTTTTFSLELTNKTDKEVGIGLDKAFIVYPDGTNDLLAGGDTVTKSIVSRGFSISSASPGIYGTVTHEEVAKELNTITLLPNITMKFSLIGSQRSEIEGERRCIFPEMSVKAARLESAASAWIGKPIVIVIPFMLDGKVVNVSFYFTITGAKAV